MSIDEKKLAELWELSKRDDFFNLVVPSTIRELIGEIRLLKMPDQPVELSPDDIKNEERYKKLNGLMSQDCANAIVKVALRAVDEKYWENIASFWTPLELLQVAVARYIDPPKAPISRAITHIETLKEYEGGNGAGQISREDVLDILRKELA